MSELKTKERETYRNLKGLLLLLPNIIFPPKELVYCAHYLNINLVELINVSNMTSM